MTVEEIKTQILAAATLHESSYDKELSQYTVELQEACLSLNPELGQLYFLALDSWWNDTIDWANGYPEQSATETSPCPSPAQ